MESFCHQLVRILSSIILCLTAGHFVSIPLKAGENKTKPDSSARSVVWVQQAGGLKHDKIRGMAVDEAGNCFVTGEFTEEAQFGDKTAKSRGSMDFVLAKYSPKGKLLWLQTAGGSKIDRGYEVAVDQAGNSFVTGHFQSPAFQIGDTTLTSNGDYDYFIAKYDPTGKLLWAQNAGGAGYDYGHGIAVTPQGDCYVTGSFAGEVTLGKSQSKKKRGRSLFVAKYDTTGKILWSRMATEGHSHSGQDIKVDSAGNCYVSGSMSGLARLAGHKVGTDTKIQDIFLAKLTTDGEFVWSTNSGGQANGLSTGVAVDQQGNCFLTGMFKNKAAFGTTTLTSSGAFDIFVARINSDGTPAWAHSGGGEKIDYGLGITADRAGNCYITGEFTNDVKFMGKHLTQLGGRDLFIARFSPQGKLDWLEVMGGEKSDLSYTIAVDNNNHCFISGAFSPTTQYQDHQLKSRGSNDIFLLKLGQ